jgi:uncharacterized protein YoxC
MMGATPESLEARKVDRIDRRRSTQTWTYVGMVALGLFPVFITPGLWVMPIVAMVVYAALAHGPAVREGAVFEFADAFYYLGFTLSIGSLLAALDPFHLGAEIDAKRIFHLFGLGMLTTIIGVVGRTGLQIFYRTPSENLESTNKRLIEEAEVFLGRIRNLSESVATTAEGTANYLERRVTPALGAVGISLDDLRSKVEGVTEAAAAIKSTGERSVTALDEFAIAHERAAREAVTQSDKLATSQKDLSAACELAIREAGAVAERAQSQLQTTELALRGVHVQAVECQKSFAGLTDQIAAVQIDTNPLLESVNSLTSAFNRGAASTDKSLAGLDEMIEAYRIRIGSLSEAAGVVAAHDIQPALSGLAIQLEAMATALRKQADVIDGDQLFRLQEAAQQQLQTVQKINGTLDEIVDAATRRLKQIQ